MEERELGQQDAPQHLGMSLPLIVKVREHGQQDAAQSDCYEFTLPSIELHTGVRNFPRNCTFLAGSPIKVSFYMGHLDYK